MPKLKDVVLLFYYGRFCGCFSSRAEASKWIGDLVKQNNTPRRIEDTHGRWATHDPLHRHEFKIIRAATPTKRVRDTILKNDWNGWDAEQVQGELKSRAAY